MALFVTAGEYRLAGMLVGILPATDSSRAAKAKNSTGAGSAMPKKVTGLVVPPLWLCVPGTRRTRAASAVTVSSALEPLGLGKRLELSATGSHAMKSTGAVSGQ